MVTLISLFLPVHNGFRMNSVFLQHRDLTENDYETLLQLDQTVQPTTLPAYVINYFATRLATSNDTGEMVRDLIR